MIRINSIADIASSIKRFADESAKCLESGPVEWVCRGIVKKREQEKKYHAMIADIARSKVIKYGETIANFEFYYPNKPEEVAKVLLIVWYEEDLKSSGESLKRPSSWIINPVNGQPIQIRPQSSQFTVKEAAGFIEFLYSIGAENKIAWSDPETRHYEEMMRIGI